MGSQRISSFSEIALLNNTVLDLLCPPECEKKKIKQHDSILETLIRSKENLFSNPSGNTLAHRSLKPLRCVLRVFYTALVTATVSPLGVACRTVQTAAHLGKYSIARYKGDEAQKNIEWEKVKRYAWAAFTDLSVALCGATAIFAGAMAVVSPLVALAPHVTVADSICFLVFGGLMGGISTHVLGGFYPTSILPQLIADNEERVGMYIALELRNKLGIVGEDGKLLKFSKADHLEWNRIRMKFEGDNINNLGLLVMRAELELVDHVRAANQWLQKNNQPLIKFSYPFKGTDVADAIQKALKESSVSAEQAGKNEKSVGKESDKKDAKAESIRQNLILMDRKISILKGIFETSRDLGANGSLGFQILRALAKQPHKEFTFQPLPETFILREYYSDYFNAPFMFDPINVPEELASLYEKTPSLIPLDPDTPDLEENASLYEVFKQRIRKEKWKFENQEPTEIQLYELIGLKKDYNYDDCKKAINRHNLALHPDKNREKGEEANELFLVLNYIANNLK